MNKEAIRNTAFAYPSKEDEGYIVVESPLCPEIGACCETEAEAWALFDDMLEEHYKAYLAGRLANPVMGRPSKGKSRLGIEVAEDIKEGLADLAKLKGISQGEAVEFLFGFWNRSTAKHPIN